MADNNNIKEFTTADIEKYWSGKLSTAEMHAMEKAAMDDPFLADALEGYANTTTPSRDIDSLKEKIDSRISAAPVVNIKKKRSVWLRVAAAVIIIAGAGILLQQYVFEKQARSPLATAQAEDSKKPEDTASEGRLSGILQQQTPVDSTSKDSQTLGLPSSNLSTVLQRQPKAAAIDSIATNKNDLAAETVSTFTQPGVAPETEKKVEAKRSLEEVKTDTLKANYQKDAFAKESINYPAAAKAKTENRRMDYDQLGMALSNSFRYRVVDAQNNPVPFAKVLSTRDNVGTYTDVKGNFNLLSSDSVLDVQVKSLGYNAANYKLVPSNQGSLVLKEDEETRRQITAQNRKMVSSVIRKDSAELEEPEVGWGNYNTYVANNIQIPENIRARNNTRSDVELSFDVDRDGHPINIKVTKSSRCKACDDEAIRLLREGPKWKRKGKKNKTTISIAVDQ